FEVVVRISEKGFRRSHELRIVFAQAKRAALVRRGGHGVHVGIVREAGVRVVIVNGNAFNFLREAVGDRWEFRRGERAGLSEEIWRCAEKENYKNQEWNQALHANPRLEMNAYFESET